jgi:CHAD domain-containing protein
MAPILDRSVDPIAEDLKWFSNQLGPARDSQVQRMRLTGSDAAGTLQPSEAQDAVDAVLLARVEHGVALAQEAWSSERHAAMMTGLGRLFATEVITAAGDRPATEVLAPLVANDLRRVRRRAGELDGVTGLDHDELVHELRKATKRARYTSALLVPTMGKPALRLGHRLQRLQDVLGERQDSAVARALLAEVLKRGELDGAGERAVRQLVASEEAQSAELDARVAALVRKALKRGRFLET